MIPKVKVQIIELDRLIKFVHYLLNPINEGERARKNRLLQEYPLLREKLGDLDDFNLIKSISYDFFQKKLLEKNDEMSKATNNFLTVWKKVGDSVLKALADLVECKWDEPYKEITANISLTPSCPRYLDTNSYDLCYKFTNDEMIAASIHEILHIIYFKKWNEEFPELYYEETYGFEDEKTIDEIISQDKKQHLVWQLSEIVVGILLNHDCIQKVFKFDFKSYACFENMTINDRRLMDYIREYYEDRKDFKGFLSNSFEFLEKNEKYLLGHIF